MDIVTYKLRPIAKVTLTATARRETRMVRGTMTSNKKKNKKNWKTFFLIYILPFRRYVLFVDIYLLCIMFGIIICYAHTMKQVVLTYLVILFNDTVLLVIKSDNPARYSFDLFGELLKKTSNTCAIPRPAWPCFAGSD